MAHEECHPGRTFGILMHVNTCVLTHTYVRPPPPPVTQDLALTHTGTGLVNHTCELFCCPSVWLSDSLVIFSLLDNVHFLFSYSSQPLSLHNEKLLEC